MIKVSGLLVSRSFNCSEYALMARPGVEYWSLHARVRATRRRPNRCNQNGRCDPRIVAREHQCADQSQIEPDRAAPSDRRP